LPKDFMTPHDSATPRRVLIVSRSLPCHVSGGLEFHVVDQAVGLAREGVQVHLLSTPVPNPYKAELAARGVTLHTLENAKPGIYTRDYFRRIGRKIIELHNSLEYFDIIHGHEFALGPPIDHRGLTYFMTPKIVITVHGTITTETPLHPDVFIHLSSLGQCKAILKFGRRWLFARSWHQSLELADGLIVDSEFTRRELHRIHPDVLKKVSLVPLSLDMERYPALDHAESRRLLGWPGHGDVPVLLTVGRLEWQKGQELALQALASLTQLKWKYIVIGTGTESKHIERLAQRLGLEARVEFMGRVSDETKARALAGADLFLWPERTHPAFGLAGLESLVMGTPVAAARRGAIPEIIDASNGVLFPPNDPAALAEAIRPLIADRAQLASMRINMRERTLARVDPHRMIRETLNAYAKVSTKFQS